MINKEILRTKRKIKLIQKVNDIFNNNVIQNDEKTKILEELYFKLLEVENNKKEINYLYRFCNELLEKPLQLEFIKK